MNGSVLGLHCPVNNMTIFSIPQDVLFYDLHDGGHDSVSTR